MSFGLSEGTLLGGRYRLERVLGAGGMASVWLARDERLGRSVALKLLSDTLITDPSYLSRFRRESRVAAGLSHPNLVAVYDFGGEGERPYLAMEYVEGETLADRIRAGTSCRLDPVGLAQGVLAALQHIHEAGIVHRDIKPANVMITKEGAVKVTDFGIAQPEDATRLTSTGLVVGTRSYMAPEVLRGETATARSDLYSSGVVLKEASGETMPAELVRLTTRLADDEPARRPRSASQALAELGAASVDPTAPTEPLSSDAATATAPTVAVGTETPPSPMRWLGAAALLTVLALLGILLLGGGGSSDDQRNRDAGAGAGGAQDEPSGADRPETTAEPTTTQAPAPAPDETPEAKPEPGKAEEAKPPKPAKGPPEKAKGPKKP